MKRSHRRWHAPAWLLVAVASAVVIVLALRARPAPPANPALPPALAAATDGG